MVRRAVMVLNRLPYGRRRPWIPPHQQTPRERASRKPADLLRPYHGPPENCANGRKPVIGNYTCFPDGRHSERGRFLWGGYELGPLSTSLFVGFRQCGPVYERRPRNTTTRHACGLRDHDIGCEARRRAW